MDRRVFQPRPTSNAERQRSAIGVSLLILVAGGLWLLSHRSRLPAPNNGGVKMVPDPNRASSSGSPRIGG